MAILMSYHQTFVDTVRSTGGRNAYRVLVVQGPSTDIEATNTLMKAMPNDKVPGRLMAEVHFYSPFNFALMTKDESWASRTITGARPTIPRPTPPTIRPRAKRRWSTTCSAG